jgi:hypothetical protein
MPTTAFTQARTEFRLREAKLDVPLAERVAGVRGSASRSNAWIDFDRFNSNDELAGGNWSNNVYRR